MLLLSRIFIGIILIAIFTALLINRFIFSFVQNYIKKRDDFASKVVVIGYNPLSKKLIDYLEKDQTNKQIIGFCEDVENVDELSNYPILGSVADTLETCKKHNINEIYSTIAPEHNKNIYTLMKDADQNCIRFKIVPDLGFFINKKMHVDYVEGLPVISLRHEPLEDINNTIRKRTFDIVVSLFVTVFVLSWLIPIVGLLIWLESKGPIFFIQPRSGKNNKDFMCLKFRSMRVNESANTQQATRSDARITRIGKFLRRTSLDEFPQFINVLKGDMSIVGPRPHMLKHTDEYSRLIEEYMVRQLLKPGITGWAQVNGYRGETTNVWQMKKRVEHDLWYMENWNLLLDLKIVFMTVANTIKGEENAF
jgi:putative colanic acid biosynthesis UDP-glucose lipid carrier transferase